ncbi:hypothetical protein EXM22_09775 [Oceanispirochaeta crateris]|uniref:Cyclic nucleotide-binding domain-containing protein n=1 Tax=Oceanispirochaeta crateris TaxID=2518645 RepID=A0A5C1QMS5_9SPIO|nr:Crp/Fnr family transcriptional regulator [Oceanispirochaeta crateris]QEN08260.1 hypothetical protein EXM22_09775 [Oceanispirochaeta crateris]
MKSIDLTKKRIKQTIPSGIVIILQGTQCKSFNILHSGMVEVLYAENVQERSAPEAIIDMSLRIGLVKSEAMIGITGLLSLNDDYTISIRTVSECMISTHPMDREEFISQIHQDLSLNFKILRDLCTRIESALYLFKNYKYLWHKYASIADSIALGIPGTSLSVGEIKNRNQAELKEYSAYLKALITEDDQALLPKSWDYNLFLGEIQNRLKLYENHDKTQAEKLIDYPQFLFIKRLIQKNEKILNALFAKDDPTNQYVFDFLGRTIESIFKANIKLTAEIKELIEMIYSDKGWAVQAISGSKNSDPQKRNFLHFLAKFSWRCRKDTMTLLGIDIFTEFRVFSALKNFKNFIIPEEDKLIKSGSAAETSGIQKRLAKYNNLLPKILEFSCMSDEFNEEFQTLMDQLLKAEKKHGSDSSLQKIRDSISLKYWQLYEACFLKVIDSDLKGFIPGIMLHFGVIDERFLTNEDLLTLDSFYANNLFNDDEIPVMTLPYFLEKIYKSEIPASMTEMGDLFKTILKSQEKLTKKERENTYIYKDLPEDRVRFEIRKIAGELSKMLFGNKKKALPFLCSETLSGNMKRFFINPDSFIEIVQKYRQRDFSLFYREVLFKHKLGSDFIQTEVVPNFIFYPSFGTRAIMWQEMDSNNKNSAGRIFFPLFFSEKLKDTILTQLAYFRWELQKSIAGYNWTDPVEGGLVGVYYDYIRYFKKNPNITPEAKERLEEFVKKTNSDKDRFTKEYSMWVEHEYHGKMRLNNYVRDIFYRYCPFPRKKREEMSQKPSFSIMENKFQNRRQKELLKLKSKAIKFEKKKTPLPVEIDNYRNFLEL